MNEIYERIEYLIKQEGMTKRQFAQEMKISTGNMGDWKRGKSTPGVKVLVKTAEFFEVSLDWLLTGKEPESAKFPPSRHVSESKEAYFFDLKRQLDYHLEELSEEELLFIREYLRFARHRKNPESE